MRLQDVAGCDGNDIDEGLAARGAVFFAEIDGLLEDEIMQQVTGGHFRLKVGNCEFAGMLFLDGDLRDGLALVPELERLEIGFVALVDAQLIPELVGDLSLVARSGS